MVNDSMKSNKIIGMIQPQSSSYQKVQPELHKVGCIGKITSFRETEDGRYLIELQGLIRFKKIKEIKILNLWVVSQYKNEYNPIHYHEGDLSGVGYLKIPKYMTKNKNVKNKKIKTNGTIDFINGQKAFLSKSIFNLIPKTGDLLIFPNYLMHTAYPFNIEEERRSFSFNAKIIFNK